MLGELGTKKKVLDQEHQKRIEEQTNYNMETIRGTMSQLGTIINFEFHTCPKNKEQ